MGTILREENKFSNVKKIKEAYKAAFHRDSKEIDAALDDRSFLIINSIRNLIVHNAARFDKEYIENYSKFPGAPLGEIGELIAFDGEKVHSMLAPAAAAAARLFNAVETWVSKN